MMKIDIGEDPAIFLDLFERMNEQTVSLGNIDSIETFTAKEELIKSILRQAKELVENV